MGELVELAFAIALTCVLGFVILVVIVLFCVYHKQIKESRKPIEFDNNKHNEEKDNKVETNSDDNNKQMILPKLKSFKDVSVDNKSTEE